MHSQHRCWNSIVPTFWGLLQCTELHYREVQSSTDTNFPDQICEVLNTKSFELAHTGSCRSAPFTHSWDQWWANIIKWTKTNLWIYSDATLCTDKISKYIWMPHYVKNKYPNIFGYHIFTKGITKYIPTPEKTQIQIRIIFEGNLLIIIIDWIFFWKGLTHASSNSNFTLDIFLCKKYTNIYFFIKKDSQIL